ncbi:hypothetical protein ACE6H2_011230 [Prunus campanulata]
MSWEPRPPGEDDPVYGMWGLRVEDEGHLKRVEFDSEVIEMCENVPQVRMISMYMDHRDNLDDVLNSQIGSNVYCHYSSQVYHYADDVRTPTVILQELPQFDKAIVLHDGLGKATSNEVNRTRKPTPSMNSATGKCKEKVAVVDEGCVQHEPIKGNSKGKEKAAEVDEGCVQRKTTKATSKGKEKVAEVDEGLVDAHIKQSSETDDESDPDYVDSEYGIDEDDDDEVFLHEVDEDGEWGGANADQSVPKPSNPPNERYQPGKKKKAKSTVGNQPDSYDDEMERKNQMREKAKQRAEVLKEKRDKKKAEAA